MKRHPGIIALSRDHHFGLLFCWKIRQGIRKQVPAERMQAYVQYFWDHHLQRHFEEEESVLFTAIPGSYSEQAIAEHADIRRQVAAVSTEKSVQHYALNAIANKLEEHIRFEERTLFPYIEKELSDQLLSDIGHRLEQSDQGRPKDDYADEFWL